MSKLYLAKISKEYPQQFERNFYAAGAKNDPWYGGIEPGDYVFPIFDSAVSKLWRVKEFTSQPNEINENGSVQFEVVRQFSPVRISSTFARYRFFQIDINIVNRLTKSTSSMARGFFPINTEPGCPALDDIDLSDTRSIYIALETHHQRPAYRENDLRILINNGNDLRIASIDIHKSGGFQKYDPLLNLYLERNEPDERYTLQELLDYAIQDKAEKKREYLKSVIDEIRKAGFFTVGSPIGLYDNILVGRKKTRSRTKGEDDSEGLATPDMAEDNETVGEVSEEFKEYDGQ